MKLKLVEGDLFDQDVEVIVNARNRDFSSELDRM